MCYTLAMHRSVYEKLKWQIEKRLPGVVFVTREFLELGSRAAVDEALSRLAREGVIRRLGRGLYDVPGPIPFSVRCLPILTKSPPPLPVRQGAGFKVPAHRLRMR